ncbi:DUF6491 family protein [Iodidimonas sp. MBR-55]|jgi:hypothetical protein|uniref:DUF6491 family protein n=2 Tax=Iodidimonas TaxID=2066486 RepID=UPI0032B151A6
MMALIMAIMMVHGAAKTHAGQEDQAGQEDMETDQEADALCVSIDQISRSDIIDDQTILLKMLRGDDLLMHLKYSCPQLAFHDFFSYEPTMGQLCAEIDHIMTRAGFSCEIGSFSAAASDQIKGSDQGFK